MQSSEIKPATPVNDEAVREFAESELNRAVGWYLKLLINYRQLESSGKLSGEFGKELWERIEENARSIGYLSGLMGLEPSQVVVGKTEELLDRFDQGVFLLEMAYGSLSKEDRPTIEQILGDLQSGKLEFSSSGREKEEKKIKQRLLEKEYLASLPNKFGINQWLDGQALGSGGRARISYSEEESLLMDREYSENTLVVALKPGREIIIGTSRWDEETFPPDKIIPIEEGITFPICNAPFRYQGRETELKNNERSFLCLDGLRRLNSRLYILEAALLTDEGPKVGNQVLPSTRERIRNILDHELGLTQERLRITPMVNLLLELDTFIVRKQSGESRSNVEELNLNWLVDEYEKTGSFPGTCQAEATFKAGFLETLGLPVRVVNGFILQLEEGSLAGHTWPEVYLMSLQGWVPVDSGAFLSYPHENDGVVYFLEGNFYLKKDEEIELEVTYRDQ